MKNKVKRVALVFLILFYIALSYKTYSDSKKPFIFSGYGNRAYSINLDDALEAIEYLDENAIYANTPKWDSKRDKYIDELNSAKLSRDMLEVIGSANAFVGGKDAYLYTGYEPRVPNTMYTDRTNYNSPKYHIEDNILIFDSLGTPGMDYKDYDYMKYNSDFSEEYIEEVHKILYEHSDVSGIVIDNSFWLDMNFANAIAAFAPVLPDGRVFEFLDKNQDVKGGMTINGGEITNYLEDNTVSFTMRDYPGKIEKPILIVITKEAKNNEELFILAFKDLPNVALYGQNTSGTPVLMNKQELGTNVHMTTLTRAVRTRTDDIYCEDSIVPDVKDKSSSFSISNPAIEYAKKWISEYR